MNRMVILLLVAIAGITAEELVAVVRLAPHSPDKIVTGELTLTQSEENGPVKLSGSVYGLTEGLHGFHVHEKGDLREGCNSTGGHFNPHKQTHGAPEDDVRHVGDLGNIRANSEGVATINITDRLISLSGPHNVIGRAIVVHAGEDDLGAGNSTLSLTTGDAGERWACGVIGILSPTGSWNNSGSFTSPSMSVLLIPLLAVVFLQRQKI